MGIIPFPEGKKVFTKDGIYIGKVKRVYISEFGVHTAVIETTFTEFPEFEVLMTELKHTQKQIGGKIEDVYILRNIPIKLQMIIANKGRLEQPRKTVPQKVPLPTTTQPQTHNQTQEHSSKQIIYTDSAPKPVGPYSQAIRVGKFMFVSGQIPIDPRSNTIVHGDIKTQTKIVLENISNILSAAGYSLNDVVMVYVFLKDLTQFAEFNEVYAKYFGQNRPARVTVEVSRLPKDVDIEISVIAYRE